MYKPHVIGKLGEKIALEFLEELGLTLIDSNWRTKPTLNGAGLRGELDLIMKEGRRVVFVEVKTTTRNLGEALAHINSFKCKQLRNLAYAWRREHPEVRGYSRGDVVAIELNKSDPNDVVIEYLVGVW